MSDRRDNVSPAVDATDVRIGAVAIGRNEGDRLKLCLNSLRNRVDGIVYVDSGSTDDSLEIACAAGALVLELDMSRPFNPSRARNEGFERLMAEGRFDYVQFVDGDCEVQPVWLETAVEFLKRHPDVAVACGRRRERFPDATIWNRLIDMEWNIPVGETKECGGDALMRAIAVQEVGGFDPRMVVNEEAELCVRLRQAGWRVFRLDAEMTLHDAAMTRFGQWWNRTRRSGRGYAQSVKVHGAPPEHHKVPELRRALFWGLGIPLAALLGALFVTSWALFLLLAWPAQVLRLAFRGERPLRAIFLVLGKIAEAIGILEYWLTQLSRRQIEFINYK